MMNQCEHFSGEKLSEFLDGVLPETERLAVATHLADCAECRRERDELLHVIQSLAALPVECVSDGFRQGVMDRIGASQAPPVRRVIPLRRYMVRALPIAATLLIAISFGLSLLGDPEQPKPEGGDLRAFRERDVPAETLTALLAPSPKNEGMKGAVGVAADGEPVDQEHDAANFVEGALKMMKATPEAALMDKALAECAKDAFGGVHQTLTMEADDPDALAQRAVAAAAGLGVNATILPSAKKKQDGAGDIRVRLTIPRAQYDALLKKLANLTSTERRQVLENAFESEDALLAEAPTRHGLMRKTKRSVAPCADVMSKAVYRKVGRTRAPGPAARALAPPGVNDGVPQGARRSQDDAGQEAARGVSLAVGEGGGGSKETAWITLIIRVVPPRPQGE